MKTVVSVLRYFLPMAVFATLGCGLVYAAVHQSLRQGANDPQIQIAEDTAAAMEKGVIPQTLVSGEVDIEKSLAPFAAIYDLSGRTLVGSGRIRGEIPAPPAGVFEYAKQNGQDRVTWQPEPGVRQALVVVYYKEAGGGFAVSGRSLREVERQAEDLSLKIAIAWIAAIFLALGTSILWAWKPKEKLLSQNPLADSSYGGKPPSNIN